MASSVQVYVDMGSWFYEWDTNDTDYEGINGSLGVVFKRGNSETTNKKDFLRGVNNIKPAKVTITYGTSSDGAVPGGETKTTKVGVCTRMCSPAKAEEIRKGDTSIINKDIKVKRRGANTKTYKVLSIRVK